MHDKHRIHRSALGQVRIDNLENYPLRIDDLLLVHHSIGASQRFFSAEIRHLHHPLHAYLCIFLSAFRVQKGNVSRLFVVVGVYKPLHDTPNFILWTDVCPKLDGINFIRRHADLAGLHFAIGDGTTNDHSSPIQIVASGVVAVAGGLYHSHFIKDDGSLWAMGRNDHGQLGIGHSPPFATNSPMKVLSSNVVAIAAGDNHSLLLESNGSLWAAGYNEFGQLGIGTSGSTADSYAFQRVWSSGVTTIAAGGNHSLFTKSGGSLWGMGDDFSGDLGDGGSQNVSISKQIIPTNVLESVGGVIAVACGETHSLFLKSDGSLWGMGYDFYGELGDGFNIGELYPEQILPRPQPVLAGTTLYVTNLMISATCRFGGIFCLLTSTNLNQPRSQWSPIETNFIQGPSPNNYSVILTNEINSGGPSRFYLLESQ